jgi:hypothetical protein
MRPPRRSRRRMAPGPDGSSLLSLLGGSRSRARALAPETLTQVRRSESLSMKRTLRDGFTMSSRASGSRRGSSRGRGRLRGGSRSGRARLNWCSQANVRSTTERTRPRPEPCAVAPCDLGPDPTFAQLSGGRRRAGCQKLPVHDPAYRDAGRDLPRASRAHPATFATKTTAHPAQIPHEVARSTRAHPPIPATSGSASPAHAGNPRLSPPTPQAP